MTLFTDTPRALAATPDGALVYAAGFHTGNQTTDRGSSCAIPFEARLPPFTNVEG